MMKNAPGPITRTEGIVIPTLAAQIANGCAICHLLSVSHFFVAGSEA
jgi:hypothetical protein